MKRIESINDFVVKFANVNGSGSASANTLFAKSIMRMGVPMSPRNIFPSNIQGLPTWYEVRVSEAGWIGRRGGVDLMVAMNPQTWDKDVAEIEPGGYLFYDSSKPLPKSRFREDITVLGMPLTQITNDAYTDPRQRQLFKNIIYVGALSALLDIDPKAIEQLIGEQYKGKEKLLAPNIAALHMGRDYALANLPCPLGIRVQKADAVGDMVFLEGNSAAALGAVYGGATVAAWYPITPSSSVAEAFAKHCKKFRARARDRRGALRHRAGRGRTRLDRHGDRRRVERRARIHRHLRSRHLADAGIHRPCVLRRDSRRCCSTCSAAARRPACRRARSSPTSRCARTRRTATPSTRCCSPRIRASASSSARCRSTSPTGCRRRSSCCSTSTSA